jgi:hypothetical protein
MLNLDIQLKKMGVRRCDDANVPREGRLVVVLAGEEESLFLSDIALELVLPKQCERAGVC